MRAGHVDGAWAEGVLLWRLLGRGLVPFLAGVLIATLPILPVGQEEVSFYEGTLSRLTGIPASRKQNCLLGIVDATIRLGQEERKAGYVG